MGIITFSLHRFHAPWSLSSSALFSEKYSLSTVLYPGLRPSIVAVAHLLFTSFCQVQFIQNSCNYPVPQPKFYLEPLPQILIK